MVSKTQDLEGDDIINLHTTSAETGLNSCNGKISPRPAWPAPPDKAPERNKAGYLSRSCLILEAFS